LDRSAGQAPAHGPGEGASELTGPQPSAIFAQRVHLEDTGATSSRRDPTASNKMRRGAGGRRHDRPLAGQVNGGGTSTRGRGAARRQTPKPDRGRPLQDRVRTLVPSRSHHEARPAWRNWGLQPRSEPDPVRYLQHSRPRPASSRSAIINTYRASSSSFLCGFHEAADGPKASTTSSPATGWCSSTRRRRQHAEEARGACDEVLRMIEENPGWHGIRTGNLQFFGRYSAVDVERISTRIEHIPACRRAVPGRRRVLGARLAKNQAKKRTS